MEQTKIIDVHAHVFPDTIREKAVGAIGGYYSQVMAGKGSIEDLINHGSRIHIVKYVIHSAATKPEQVETINDYISALVSQDDRLVGFGTIHQNTPKPADVIADVMAKGLKGIKLHPEFQRFYIDDPKLYPIYEAMQGKLPLLVHTGDKESTASSPTRLLKIIEKFPSLTVIAPHLGGYLAWDEVMETLIGKNVYLDTSSALPFLQKEKAADMIRRHGVDKVLFGSDYPMWMPEDEFSLFMALGLSDEENARILYGNAAALLGMD